MGIVSRSFVQFGSKLDKNGKNMHFVPIFDNISQSKTFIKQMRDLDLT